MIFCEESGFICPCSKCLPEANVNSFALILFAEEYLKQPSIDYVVLLLQLTLIKINAEKKQDKQIKIQNVIREKGHEKVEWNSVLH